MNYEKLSVLLSGNRPPLSRTKTENDVHKAAIRYFELYKGGDRAVLDKKFNDEIERTITNTGVLYRGESLSAIWMLTSLISELPNSGIRARSEKWPLCLSTSRKIAESYSRGLGVVYVLVPEKIKYSHLERIDNREYLTRQETSSTTPTLALTDLVTATEVRTNYLPSDAISSILVYLEKRPVLRYDYIPKAEELKEDLAEIVKARPFKLKFLYGIDL